MPLHCTWESNITTFDDFLFFSASSLALWCRLVAIAESHIYHIHWRLFRKSIRVLSELFFWVLSMVALETTLPPVGQGSNNTIHGTLSALSTDPRHLHCHRSSAVVLGRGISAVEHQDWATCQENKGDLKICHVPMIIDELSDGWEAHNFLFVNFRSDIRICLAALEGSFLAKLMGESAGCPWCAWQHGQGGNICVHFISLFSLSVHNSCLNWLEIYIFFFQ